MKTNLDMDHKMATVEEINYSEAAYVDYLYEYLQKHKLEGITLEELRRISHVIRISQDS
jgi:hypothetical protein